MNIKEKNDMNNLAYKEEKKYTYADLLDIDDEKRYEIIDGELYLMASPVVIHQMLSGEIYMQIGNYLKNKKCKVFSAPLDVKLSGEEDDKEYYVVEPDIMVVCDLNKIKEKNILGAPDLAIEILSKSTSSRDRVMKLNLYQKYGIKEYWIVSPEDKSISVYILNKEGIYTIPKAYCLDEEIKVNILEGLTVSLKEFIENNEILLS